MDIIGWQNEKYWEPHWPVVLRNELDQRGFKDVKVVIADCGPGAYY